MTNFWDKILSKPGEVVAIDEEDYFEALEILPPVDFKPPFFGLGEVYTYNVDNEPVTYYFTRFKDALGKLVYVGILGTCQSALEAFTAEVKA